MGIFHKRYFCIFAFLFLLASFVAAKLEGTPKLIIASFALIASIITFVFVLIKKKRRFELSILTMAFVFVFGGFLSSFLFISLPQSRAYEHIGSGTVEMQIVSCEYSSDHATEYTVKIKQVNGERTTIKAYLALTFPSQLEYGDTVITLADIEKNEYSNGDHSVLLRVAPAEGAEIYYKSAEIVSYFSIDGILSVLRNVRGAFIGYITDVLGLEDGALLRGLLINDTSDISSKIISDFKRSGISHLLSVSGFHISLLLGGCDIFLRKLFVPRKVRCICVSVFGILFLSMTDFSASAVRSALMLFAVYLSFILSEDSDALTSLFGAVFIIVLLLPYAIFDLGLFMSFAATLGLLTIYPYFEERLPKFKVKNKLLNAFGSLLVLLIKTVLITLIANFFLLPVLWYFFGEISLSAIPANLIVSPMSAAYLVLGILALIFGKIPYVGVAFAVIVKLIGDAITNVASALARLHGAVVSLRIPFAGALIIIFTIVMSVMLVVKLKRKIFVFIPVLAFSVSFAACFAIFTLTDDGEIRYVEYRNNEILMLEKANNLTVCDISNASGEYYYTLGDYIPSHATEIDKYIVTHAHENHPYSIERILQKYFIRELYLPINPNGEDIEIVKAIYETASKYNTNITFYKSGETISVFADIRLKPCFEQAVDRHTSVTVLVETKEGESILTYSDASESLYALSSGVKSQYFLLGAHGEASTVKYESEAPSSSTAVILPYEERIQNSRAKYWEHEAYFIGNKKSKNSIVLPLC